jgi:hypothetical protein
MNKKQKNKKTDSANRMKINFRKGNCLKRLIVPMVYFIKYFKNKYNLRVISGFDFLISL